VPQIYGHASVWKVVTSVEKENASFPQNLSNLKQDLTLFGSRLNRVKSASFSFLNPDLETEQLFRMQAGVPA
jgi:hypothetical protein